MSIIIEPSFYYFGVLQGKYPIPDSSTAIRRKIVTPVIRNYPSNFNIDNNSIFNNFFQDNAAHIDSIIEKYDEKLKPYLSMEEINKFVQDWIIHPITSTYVDNMEELNKHIRKVDNYVGYIRIKKRLEIKVN
jgi:hypothetical protein